MSDYYYTSRPRYQIGATEIIIIINVAMFFLTLIFQQLMYAYCALWIGGPQDFLTKYGINIPYTITTQAYWQILTSIFMHGSFSHIFFNMYGLFIFGKPLETRWGKSKFIYFYLTTGVLANIASVIFFIMTNNPVMLIGASGAVFAILLAFGGYYPEARLLLFFVIPIKVKWAVVLYAGVELAFEIFGSKDGIAHITHLFGLLFAFLYLLIVFKTNPIKEMFFPDKNKFYYQ